MSRHCYIIGCSNGDYRLKRWSGVKCPLHFVWKGDFPCDCPPPFRLYHFPGRVKNPQVRDHWLNLIKRKDPKNKLAWLEPTKSSVVCSLHFVDGKPTNLHPHPQLLLNPDELIVINKKKSEKRKTPTKKADNLSSRSDSEPETKIARKDSSYSKDTKPAINIPQRQFMTIIRALKVIIFLLLAVIRKLKEENRILKMKNVTLRETYIHPKRKVVPYCKIREDFSIFIKNEIKGEVFDEIKEEIFEVPQLV